MTDCLVRSQANKIAIERLGSDFEAYIVRTQQQSYLKATSSA